jgi:hypothetical protein
MRNRALIRPPARPPEPQPAAVRCGGIEAGTIVAHFQDRGMARAAVRRDAHRDRDRTCLAWLITLLSA